MLHRLDEKSASDTFTTVNVFRSIAPALLPSPSAPDDGELGIEGRSLCRQSHSVQLRLVRGKPRHTIPESRGAHARNHDPPHCATICGNVASLLACTRNVVGPRVRFAYWNTAGLVAISHQTQERQSGTTKQIHKADCLRSLI